MIGSCSSCQIFYGRILPVLPDFLTEFSPSCQITWQNPARPARFSDRIQPILPDFLTESSLSCQIFYDMILSLLTGFLWQDPARPVRFSMAGCCQSFQVFWQDPFVQPGFLWQDPARPARFSMAGSSPSCHIFCGRMLPVVADFLNSAILTQF